MLHSLGSVRRYSLEMAALAVLTVTTLVMIPKNVPTIPYVSLLSASSIKAAHGSLRSGELPQWNPYLGGGFPLAPTPYYLFHALGRDGMVVAVSALSTLALLLASRVEPLLRTVVILPAASLSFIIPSPLPLTLALYTLGFIGGNPLLRALGSVGIPDVILSVELGARNPSLPVLTASFACLADCLIAALGAIPLILRPGVHLTLTILAVTATVAILPVLIIIATLGGPTSSRRWKFSATATAVIFVAQVCLHEPPTVLMAPMMLLFLLALEHVNAWLTKLTAGTASEPLRHLIALAVPLLFIAACGTLSEPRFSVVKCETLGPESSMEYVLSPDPWFTECFKRVLSGHPVWNVPLPMDPHTGPASLLGSELGDPRVTAPLYPTRRPDVRPKVVALLVSSPPSWAERSLHALQLASTVATRGIPAREPRLRTPTKIRGHCLVGQVYDLWWRGSTRQGILLHANGLAVYRRPSAPLSTILVLLSIVAAIIETTRMETERA